MTDYSDLKTVPTEDLWRVTPEDYKAIKAFEDELYEIGYALNRSEVIPAFEWDPNFPLPTIHHLMAWRPEFEMTSGIVGEFMATVRETARSEFSDDGCMVETTEGVSPVDGSHFISVYICPLLEAELHSDQLIHWKLMKTLQRNFDNYIQNGWGS